MGILAREYGVQVKYKGWQSTGPSHLELMLYNVFVLTSPNHSESENSVPV